MNQESIEQVYASMGISREVYDYAQKIWDSLKGRWEEIDSLSEYNQLKVIGAMQKNRVSEACLLTSPSPPMARHTYNHLIISIYTCQNNIYSQRSAYFLC